MSDNEEKESKGLEDIFDEVPNEKSEYYQILKDLLDSEKDLELKTEITKPLSWSALKIFMDFLDSHKMPLSKSILENFIKTSFKYLISKDRKSRSEIISAIKQSDLGLNPNTTSENNKEVI